MRDEFLSTRLHTYLPTYIPASCPPFAGDRIGRKRKVSRCARSQDQRVGGDVVKRRRWRASAKRRRRPHPQRGLAHSEVAAGPGSGATATNTLGLFRVPLIITNICKFTVSPPPHALSHCVANPARDFSGAQFVPSHERVAEL